MFLALLKGVNFDKVTPVYAIFRGVNIILHQNIDSSLQNYSFIQTVHYRKYNKFSFLTGKKKNDFVIYMYK